MFVLQHISLAKAALYYSNKVSVGARAHVYVSHIRLQSTAYSTMLELFTVPLFSRGAAGPGMVCRLTRPFTTNVSSTIGKASSNNRRMSWDWVF